MNCDRAREHFDSIVGPDERFSDHEVLEHISNCRNCGAELKTWEKMYHALTHTRKPSPPEGLVEEILSAVATAGSAGSSPNPHAKLLPGPWLKPVWAAAALLLLSFGFWLVTRQFPNSAPAQQEAVAPKSPTLEVSLKLPEARTVSLVGDFNDWNKLSHTLLRDREGNWQISLEVEPGYYQYQLLVDGNTWILDPDNPTIIADGFGGFNSGVYL